ncbi:NlpC/P60 family protein [Metabacillus fastidiosus]|uniref:XkdQ/YqbQ family protein n=1 Tax=Metabacillus fastidiosus TaxID=1458 RepID=UPI002E2357D9|nr:NlpC/P60 family protein [Metabacillus fastidiosus]
MSNEIKELDYSSVRPQINVIYYADKKVTYLDGVIQSISITGDVARSCRKCEISFKNTSDGRSRLIDIKMGKEIRILHNKNELFRGIIFNNGRNERGEETITVYDPNIYLSKNSDVIKENNITASELIKKLAKSFGIKTGRIDNTGHKIPKLYIAGKTLYDMIVIALTETQKATGQRYMLQNNKGALELIAVRTATKWLRVEDGRNLISASYSESIEDVKTKVKITSGDEFNPTQTAVAGGTSEYGTMQHYEHNSDADAASKINDLAKQLLNAWNKPKTEMDVETLGVADIVSGTAIIVQNKLTGLKGSYFVLADSHRFTTDGVHTMSLTLSKTLDLPYQEYEPPQEKSSNSSAGIGYENGTSLSVVYESGWIATAYDPALGGINGSGDYKTTASGTKVQANRTIAVDPKLIPYGSIVAIKVPSMPQYDGLYLAEDTGGAIKGKRIDILIRGKKNTANFGRRQVQVAVIQRGNGKADARAIANKWTSTKRQIEQRLNAPQQVNTGGSSKAQKVVEIANSYKGDLVYKFGGKNINSGVGDCSGFTYYVYKQVGIDIGHGTSVQVTKGKKINTADAQPGDLVFFQNTYKRGVSHVGVVTRKGYCVSLKSSEPYCAEHSYTTGYWGEKFMQIRRVL